MPMFKPKKIVESYMIDENTMEKKPYYDLGDVDFYKSDIPIDMDKDIIYGGNYYIVPNVYKFTLALNDYFANAIRRKHKDLIKKYGNIQVDSMVYLTDMSVYVKYKEDYDDIKRLLHEIKVDFYFEKLVDFDSEYMKDNKDGNLSKEIKKDIFNSLMKDEIFKDADLYKALQVTYDDDKYVEQFSIIFDDYADLENYLVDTKLDNYLISKKVMY